MYLCCLLPLHDILSYYIVYIKPSFGLKLGFVPNSHRKNKVTLDSVVLESKTELLDRTWLFSKSQSRLWFKTGLWVQIIKLWS